MSVPMENSATCPFDAKRDDRKTAQIVASHARSEKGAKSVSSFSAVRDILRSPTLKQAGGGAEYFDISVPEKAPVFFLDGPEHKKKRATIARYFTPKAITTRYNIIMDRVIGEQLATLQKTGSARLDLMSFDLAVAVAADIVGLTVTDRQKMSRRLSVSLSAAFMHHRGFFGRQWVKATKLYNQIDFFLNDVKPSIRDRKANPQDDILSHLIKVGLSDKAIMMECMTYAAAGMVTTREFIVMAAWHMFDNPALKDRFVNGAQDEQMAILLEILRLEPIAAFLYRSGDKGRESEFYALQLRDANTDETVVGSCPFALDPDRATKTKTNGSFLSFGDGAHHCPGWQVALHETRAFIDALFRLPGIRLDRAPDIGWSDMLQSYELRNAVVGCDPL